MKETSLDTARRLWTMQRQLAENLGSNERIREADEYLARLAPPRAEQHRELALKRAKES